MNNYIPNSIPVIAGNEKKYVTEAIRTGWISTGNFITQFENSVAKYCNVKYAIATGSGTAALHIMLILAGIKKGNGVLLPNITFAASANAITYCNAIPIFADVSLDDWCLCPIELNKFIELKCSFRNSKLIIKNSGIQITAMMPVHLYGHPAKLIELRKICQKYNIVMIEDGAEALGALYRSKSIGNGSKFCGLSFNGNKIITTGSGGMILTNSINIANKARYLISQSKDDPKEFIHHEVGYNYRMANINAAFGLAQMEKLEEFVSKKRQINNYYNSFLKNYEYLSIKMESKNVRSSFWMVILTLDKKMFKKGSLGLRNFLEANSIEARPIWQPLYRQKAYKNAFNLSKDNSEELYKYSLCLPCSVNLKKKAIE